eukprot:9977862-Lingulodinium_polyedra.AAC.1
MLKELQTWAKLKCFSRRPRQGARNVIDVRWVTKFKRGHPTVDIAKDDRTGRQVTDIAEPVRAIRARLTVR